MEIIVGTENFDWKFYLSNNPDLSPLGIDSFESAWLHWVNHGQHEGRVFTSQTVTRENFDWEFYLSENTDLAALGINSFEDAWNHWVLSGNREGRACIRPRQVFTLKRGLTYIEAEQGIVKKIIRGELAKYNLEWRLQLTLQYMYTLKRFPKNGNFLIEAGDCFPSTEDFHKPAGLDLLVYSKHRSQPYTLIPDPYFIGSLGYRDYSDTVHWEDKIPVAFWRGASTGDEIRWDNWERIPRVRLAKMSNASLDAKIVDLVQIGDAPGLRDFLKTQPFYAEGRIPFSEFLKYKFLINIDGNSCAWDSMFKKLRSNSVVLHVDAGQVQWYYHRLKPWVHYIPVKADLSDLHDQIDWCLQHESQCKEISKAARTLMESISY
jgi:hypothetical protein